MEPKAAPKAKLDTQGESTEGDATRSDDNDYCSNQVRAQATHNRILGEAQNQCRRLLHDGAFPPYYVTPPLNSYYRRLVHQVAQQHRLAHESPAAGALRKQAPEPVVIPIGQDWDAVYREVIEPEKAVLIVAPAVDMQNAPLREAARIEASRKAPPHRVKYFER